MTNCTVQSQLHVEVDVFSGRPNPGWLLDGDASQKLRRVLADLTPSQSSAADPPGLGYRGFLVADDGRSYRIYGTWVTMGSATFADPNRVAEQFLVEHMPVDLKSTLAPVLP